MKLVAPLFFVLITCCSNIASGQEVCPGKPNAHVVGRTEILEGNGTVRRITRCECNSGYESRSDGSCQPVSVIRSETRADCVRFAGNHLRDDLNACANPFLECLRQQGVPTNGVVCVSGAVASGIGLAISALDPTKAATYVA